MDGNPSVTKPSDVDDHLDPICFLKHNNVKVSISLVFAVNYLVPCTAVLDAGGGPNLVSGKLLSPKVLEEVQTSNLLNPLRDAKKKPLSVCRSVNLMVAVAHLKKNMVFSDQQIGSGLCPWNAVH